MHTRLQVVWNVPGGGAGLSVFNVQGELGAPTVGTCLSHLRTFFAGLAGSFPAGVTFSFDPEYTHHDQLGGLIAAGTATAPASVQGTSTANYPGPAGARIDWETATVLNKRRVRGRTYLVPMVGIYDTDGTLISGAITSIQNAATTLLNNLQTATAPLIVWSKRNAAEVVVVSPNVRDKAAVLRSRRD